MKLLGKIKAFYVGLDIKDMLFALLVVLIMVCAQLVKINSSVSEIAHEVWSVGFDLKYK